MLYYLALGIAKAFFYLKYNIKVEGKENLPENQAAIFVSNHRTYADPPLIAICSWRRFSFMAKEELFKNKIFGGLIRSLGAFPVSRGKGDMKVIDTAVERVRSGQNLAVFPEGTRSKDGKVGRGKTGAALIAAKCGAPVVPAGIIFEGEKLKFRTKIKVVYGKPIDTAQYYIGDAEPDPRKLVKLKNLFMNEIKSIVEGDTVVPSLDDTESREEE